MTIFKTRAYEKIISIIETSQTVDELLDKYLDPGVLNEVAKMKVKDVREIESRYLRRKDLLNKKTVK